MKLLYKTSVQFLGISLIVLSAGGFGLYYWIRSQIKTEIYAQLDMEIAKITKEVAAHRPVNFPFVNLEQEDRPRDIKEVFFGDTLLYNDVQKEMEGYYYLKKHILVHGKTYNISVMTSYIGWKKYADMIADIFLLVILIIAVSSVLINYYNNKYIWKPFFVNLNSLSRFSVKSSEAITWQDSDITEFQKLTALLDNVTKHSQKEYKSLQEFTENASHEIQTPLSIIRTALENLRQMPLDEYMVRQMMTISKAINRLSRLNKKLLLLVKLDNNLYWEKQYIDVGQVLTQKIELMQDLFAQRDIALDFSVKDTLTLYANPDLVKTLLLNLMTNMLRHSSTGVHASITLTNTDLTFCNPGNPLPFPDEEIFDRFKKNTKHAKSNGLGLAIVKQICLLNNWRISYSYGEGSHNFRVEVINTIKS